MLMLLQLCAVSVFADPILERYTLGAYEGETIFVGVSDFDDVAYALSDIDGTATKVNTIADYIWTAPQNTGLRVNKVDIYGSVLYGTSDYGWKIWVNGCHYMLGDKYIVATADEGLHLADEDNGFWFSYNGRYFYRQSLTYSTNSDDEMTVILDSTDAEPKFTAVESYLLYSFYISANYLKMMESSVICNHPNMIYHAEVPATCTEPGTIEYWSCPDCNKIYEDEIGTQEIYEIEELKTSPHGAMDKDYNGLCDNCGKNMPVFEKVTSKSEIMPNNKYILVAAKRSGAEYAMAIPTIEDSHYWHTDYMPAKRIYSNDDGTIDFMEAYNKNVMINEFKYIYNMSSWNDGGMRYGFHFDYKGRQWLLSYNFELSSDAYAKYGYHIVNDNGSLKIADAYQENWTNEDSYFRMLSTSDGLVFSMNNYNEDAEYGVSIYKLVESGTYGKAKYRLRDTKSVADYDVMEDKDDNAVSISGVTGIANALSQDGINTLLANFVDNNTEEVDLKASAQIKLKEATYEKMTFGITPVAYLGENIEDAVEIDDSSFKGNSMTVSLYTNGFYPELIEHTKIDGTTDYYYPEYSNKPNKFSFEYDCSENSYVQFDVTEFSDITLYSYDITAPTYSVSVYFTDENDNWYSDVPSNKSFYLNFDVCKNIAKEAEPCDLYAAFYDKDGNLIRAEKTEYAEYTSPKIEVPALGKEVETVRAFAWDENMKPLSNVYDSTYY